MGNLKASSGLVREIAIYLTIQSNLDAESSVSCAEDIIKIILQSAKCKDIQDSEGMKEQYDKLKRTIEVSPLN